MKDVTERVDLSDGPRSARRPPGRSVEDDAGVPEAGRPTPRTLTRRGVLRLQRSAGNAAVSRLVAGARGPAAGRGAGRAGQNGGTAAGPGLHGAAAGTGAPTREGVGPVAPPGMTGHGGAPGVVQRRAAEHPSPPPEPTPMKPESDPRFAKVTKQTTATAAKLRAHPPAKGEAAKAAKAAVPPAGDKDAQAKAAKADKMSGAKPGGFDKAAFMAAVRSAIAAKAPKNLEEADEFSESGKADGVKAEVMGKVTQGKEASAKDIATKTAEAPDPSKAKDKPVTPLAPDQAVAPPAPDTAAAMPAKAPPEQTDLGAGKAETDEEMAAADVSEEQLAKSNEPEFTDAVAAKKEGEEHSATAPGKVRESEAATLQDAAAGAGQSGKATVAGLVQSRAGAVSKVAGGKSEAKSKDEQARAKVAAEIKGIFDATKTDVDKILNDLDGKVATKFEQGEKAAKAAFTADHKARMERYKDQRYSGWRGKLRWAKDKLAGMPAEANNLFLESKKLYEQKMDGVISDVADLIGTELTRAKDRIAKGRDQITKFVASQPKDLQKVAGDAAKDIGDKFDQLEQDVDDKQEALVDDLATRYTEARNAVDEEIKELQAANRGLWDKAKDAIGGAIKTILKLKDMLLGVLARAAGAIGKIIKDPIGFLGNLISAVKGGVQNFGANIVEHLKKGMQAFLFGSLASAGIEIPETFDLKGIIKLVLSILGLTWTRIRTKIVKRIGDTAMDAVEKGVDIFKTLATEGVGGLWKFLVDKLSDLKDTVMDAIQDFVVVKIVKAGITWLISALNPAAAFIKACKMIYDVVMFFVEKGSQIKEFVDSVLDSIESIVGGGVGAVAKHIENTLAKILPLLIGFLASLLGLGGISEKVKEILGKVQKPVEKAVDAVINGALKLAAPIINLAKRGAKWVKGKVEKGKAWVKGKVEQGKAWAKGKVDAAKGKLGLGPKPRQDLPEDKQQHVNLAAREIEPRVRSLLEKGVSGSTLDGKLRNWKTEYQLTDLWIDHHGDKFDVKAKVNPTANIITNAVDAQGSEISRILRSVGEELMADPAVQAEVETIRQAREAQVAEGKGGTKGEAITRPAQSAAAEAAALRPPQPGQADPRRPVHTFEQVEMGGQLVTEQQKQTQTPGHAFVNMTVMIEGKAHHHAHYNPEVMAALQQMEAAGISQADIQAGMRNLLANRSPGPAFAGNPAATAQIASITRLLFVVEPARNPAAFATSVMGTDMAADVGIPIADMATAANPMHVEDAGAISRASARRLAAEESGRRKPAKQIGLDAHMMLLAERDIVIDYLEHLVKSKQLTFDTEIAVARWLREEFRKHLLDRLRAVLTRAPAAPGGPTVGAGSGGTGE
jgi:hypothetical protein